MRSKNINLLFKRTVVNTYVSYIILLALYFEKRPSGFSTVAHCIPSEITGAHKNYALLLLNTKLQVGEIDYYLFFIIGS